MAYEYLFASLPALPEVLGEKVKLDPMDLCAAITLEGGEASALGRALLYSFDIRALERIGLGVAPGYTAAHSGEELEDRSNLPVWIRRSLEQGEHDQSGYGFDIVWKKYYRNLLELSSECSSSFFKKWLVWDIGLRNAMCEHRAAMMSVQAETYIFDFGVAERRAQFKPIVETLISCEERGSESWKDMDLMVATKKIEIASDLAPAYVFNLDELMSYIVQYKVFKEFEYL